MSSGQYRYGQTVPIPFKITLNMVGVNLTLDTNIVDGDIIAFKVSRTGTVITRQVDISVEITKAHATLLPGVYLWTPASTSDTQGAYFGLGIKDVSGGGVFDENLVIWETGGHELSLLNAT